jgi:hypothetical protein
MQHESSAVAAASAIEGMTTERRMAKNLAFMPAMGAKPDLRDSLFGGFVTGGDDRLDEARRWGFLGIVNDLGPTVCEIDLDTADAGHASKCRIDVFDAAVARHPRDPQGSDHAATVA